MSGAADDQADAWSSTAGSGANNALPPHQHASPVSHLACKFLYLAARHHLLLVPRHGIGPDRVLPMRQAMLGPRTPPPGIASALWQSHTRRGIVVVDKGVPLARSKRFALADAISAAPVHPLVLVQASPAARMAVAEMARAKQAVAHAKAACHPEEPSGTSTNPSIVAGILSTSHTCTRRGSRLLPRLPRQVVFFLPAKLDDLEGAESGHLMDLLVQRPAVDAVVRDSGRSTAQAHPARHSDDSRQSVCTVQKAREPHGC